LRPDSWATFHAKCRTVQRVGAADDELAICALIAAYSDAVMCGDPKAAASVHAEDGELQGFGGAVVVGAM
jgi:hypothetical protein